MKLQAMKLLASLWMVTAGVAACSGGSDSAKDPEVSVKAKEKIQSSINAPLDKARNARDMGEERLKAMDQAVKGK